MEQRWLVYADVLGPCNSLLFLFIVEEYQLSYQSDVLSPILSWPDLREDALWRGTQVGMVSMGFTKYGG